jgi:hypothetical protein
MTTTTKLQDYLGRWITNATPGTSNATDALGRAVKTGDHDFIGRLLLFSNPSGWVQTTAYSLGNNVRLSGGAILTCTTAGTSVTGSAPNPPAVGGSVTDGTVHWKRLH